MLKRIQQTKMPHSRRLKPYPESGNVILNLFQDPGLDLGVWGQEPRPGDGVIHSLGEQNHLYSI